MQLMKHRRATIREERCPKKKLRKQRVCLLAELMVWVQECVICGALLWL